jgi:hypothetical protein
MGPAEARDEAEELGIEALPKTFRKVLAGRAKLREGPIDYPPEAEPGRKIARHSSFDGSTQPGRQ